MSHEEAHVAHQEVSLNISEPLQHEQFRDSNNPEAQTCQHEGQGECNTNTRKDSMGEYLGSCSSRETSSLTVAKNSSQTSEHLLSHPLSENTTQNELPKETQTRASMSYWIYSKGTQVQTHSSQVKTSGTTVSVSVLQNNCGASKTETVNTSITSSVSAGPSCCNASNQMSDQESQMCPPAIHSNSAEPKLCYLGNNSYMEHDDSNSSSDDEQKLVIELE